MSDFDLNKISTYGDQIVSQHFMPDALVHKILSLLHRESAFFTLETPDGKFNSDNGFQILSQVNASSVNSKMMQLANQVLLDPSATSYSKYNGQPIYKIAYYSHNWSFPSLLSAELGYEAKVVPFDNIPGFPLATGEISDPTITKGRALEEMCRHLNCPVSSSVAFGDSMNDTEIISVAGLGVARNPAQR